uniref:JAB_MPN domain-containing protein n=1 Tax=Globodera pallida TaxID=36090 RepID=A0A183BJ69_GLOPA
MSAAAVLNNKAALLVDHPRVEYVQLDSLVVMKIVKHGDIEFYAGLSKIAGETCQGILSGLISVEDKRLEVTNCFSITRPDALHESEESGTAPEASLSDENKQSEILDMLKRFRMMNIDYEQVGFYQAHPFGACFSHEMLESLVDYQMDNPDVVVIVYGCLTIRAYRLSKKTLDLAIHGDWTPELTKQAGLNFTNFFEELPIVVKNSHLMNVLLAELALSTKGKRASVQLELGTKRSLERSMKALIGTVDELNKSVNAYGKYAIEKQKYDALYNNLMQKRQVENEARQARGEQPLTLDDIKRQLKQPQMQTKNGMLDLFLNALDTDAFSTYQIETTNESVAKLHLSQAVSSQPPGGGGGGGSISANAPNLERR